MKPELMERFRDAARYDELMPRIFPGYSDLPGLLHALLAARLGADASVIDVGCGTGTALLSLAAAAPGWKLFGVDPSPLGELAQAKIEDAGLSDRIKFAVGTADKLEGAFGDTMFDAALLVLVEHLRPDDGAKLGLLEGIARRLRPGGLIVHAGLHGDLAAPDGKLALDAWEQHLHAQGFPEEMITAFKKKGTDEDSLVPESRVRELLGEAGFTGVTRFYHCFLMGGWLAQKA